MDYRSICKTLKLIERKRIGGNLCYLGLSKVSLDTPKALRKKRKKNWTSQNVLNVFSIKDENEKTRH